MNTSLNWRTALLGRAWSDTTGERDADTRQSFAWAGVVEQIVQLPFLFADCTQ